MQRVSFFRMEGFKKQGIFLLLNGLVWCWIFCGASRVWAQSSSDSLIRYLERTQLDCYRFQSKDSAGVIGLPYPYYSPSPGANALFSELYYWDCFFTNRYGLLNSGKESDLEMAKHHVNNLLHLAEKFGFVPNANRFSMLNRSQPPFLSLMVRDLYCRTGDVSWLQQAVVILEKEYDFWMNNRSYTLRQGNKEFVLNKYGHQATVAYLRHFYITMDQRLQYKGDTVGMFFWVVFNSLDTLSKAHHWLAEAESGWDFTPRFQGRCLDFLPVDLNSLMANYELNMAWFYQQLGQFAESKSEMAECNRKYKQFYRAYHARMEAMNRWMWNSNLGVYLDYEWTENRQSQLLTSASYYPVWLLAAEKRFTKKSISVPKDDLRRNKNTVPNLLRLVQGDLVMPLERGYSMPYGTQWNYGNVWAPFQAIAVETFLNSFPDLYYQAALIRRTFCTTVERDFFNTGRLVEKYPASFVENLVEEYPTPPMMGWTGAVYRWFKSHPQ